MADNIVRQDIQGLIDGWMESEQDGVLFPVPFDMAWMIAGHSTKGNAKRKLESFLEKGSDYLSELINIGRGKPLEDIKLTCNAFKELCLISKTAEGKANRLYFIEAEKKWKLVEKFQPAIAQEIELEHLKNEGRRLEAQKSQTDLQLMQFRHTVTTTMPEPLQQKILGYTEVRDVEYRDRILMGSELINDGSTTNKTSLCHRYGIKTRNGKPDFKRLNLLLDKLPSEAFDLTVQLRDNYELRREFLPELDRIVDQSDRNLYMGE